jgi:hypothetical protein
MRDGKDLHTAQVLKWSRGLVLSSAPRLTPKPLNNNAFKDM